MKINMGLIDRSIRLLIATCLVFAVASNMVKGSFDDIFLIAGIALAATVIVGMCPIYAIFGINTDKTIKTV